MVTQDLEAEQPGTQLAREDLGIHPVGGREVVRREPVQLRQPSGRPPLLVIQCGWAEVRQPVVEAVVPERARGLGVALEQLVQRLSRHVSECAGLSSYVWRTGTC
jgi:hypothetical protein